MFRMSKLEVTPGKPKVQIQHEPRAVVIDWGKAMTVCLTPKNARMLGEAIFRAACAAENNGS